jgi:hypothetical protein
MEMHSVSGSEMIPITKPSVVINHLHTTQKPLKCDILLTSPKMSYLKTFSVKFAFSCFISSNFKWLNYNTVGFRAAALLEDSRGKQCQ